MSPNDIRLSTYFLISELSSRSGVKPNSRSALALTWRATFGKSLMALTKISRAMHPFTLVPPLLPLPLSEPPRAPNNGSFWAPTNRRINIWFCCIWAARSCWIGSAAVAAIVAKVASPCSKSSASRSMSNRAESWRRVLRGAALFFSTAPTLAGGDPANRWIFSQAAGDIVWSGFPKRGGARAGFPGNSGRGPRASCSWCFDAEICSSSSATLASNWATEGSWPPAMTSFSSSSGSTSWPVRYSWAEASSMFSAIHPSATTKAASLDGRPLVPSITKCSTRQSRRDWLRRELKARKCGAIPHGTSTKRASAFPRARPRGVSTSTEAVKTRALRDRNQRQAESALLSSLRILEPQTWSPHCEHKPHCKPHRNLHSRLQGPGKPKRDQPRNAPRHFGLPSLAPLLQSMDLPRLLRPSLLSSGQIGTALSVGSEGVANTGRIEVVAANDARTVAKLTVRSGPESGAPRPGSQCNVVLVPEGNTRGSFVPVLTKQPQSCNHTSTKGPPNASSPSPSWIWTSKAMSVLIQEAQIQTCQSSRSDSCDSCLLKLTCNHSRISHRQSWSRCCFSTHQAELWSGPRDNLQPVGPRSTSSSVADSDAKLKITELHHKRIDDVTRFTTAHLMPPWILSQPRPQINRTLIDRMQTNHQQSSQICDQSSAVRWE